MNDTQIAELLHQAKTIAVVGLSSNRMRASFGVSRFLQRQGYRIIPVNPNETEVLGERAYPSLIDVPDDIDIVNIFRRSEKVPEIVDQALQKGTRCIWMQEGIINHAAAQKAEIAGIPVVMNRCILKELALLG
jgi:predicted CoA-binding protein